MMHLGLHCFPKVHIKGMLLSKALTCMKIFLYKQKWPFCQGDGYLWLYCCMNNLYIHASYTNHFTPKHTVFEYSAACLSVIFGYFQGNEMVDKQAKISLSLEPTSFKIPFSNFKPSINKYMLEEWQTSWNNSIGNKLLDIKPTIGEYQSVVRNIRREEVVLARLRLGHTRVTHSYLLQGEEHPQCVGCDAPFTVRHFLLECGDFAQVRNNCFHVDNMKELFQDIYIDSIMTFLRQINLFNKI